MCSRQTGYVIVLTWLPPQKTIGVLTCKLVCSSFAMSPVIVTCVAYPPSTFLSSANAHCTYLLRLFLCLVYSDIIALLMHPMRQATPIPPPLCQLSSEHCQCVNYRSRAHIAPPFAPMSTSPPRLHRVGSVWYDTCSRSISSIGWSSGIPSAPSPPRQPIFSPPTAAACPPKPQNMYHT